MRAEVHRDAYHPPISRGELIRRNLPVCDYATDILELDEVWEEFLKCYSASSEEFVKQMGGTGNVWALSGSGAVLSVQRRPAVAWAHYLRTLYSYEGTLGSPAPDPHETRTQIFNGCHNARILQF